MTLTLLVTEIITIFYCTDQAVTEVKMSVCACASIARRDLSWQVSLSTLTNDNQQVSFPKGKINFSLMTTVKMISHFITQFTSQEQT